MDEKFSRPKSFGQVLDHTFSLSKKYFKVFFLIALIFLGPVYLLQAVFELMAGVSLFKGTGVGESFFDETLSSFDETQNMNIGADLAAIAGGLLTLIVLPFVMGAIIFAVNHIRKGESFTPGDVIRQAASRYWPLLGSSILYGILVSILYGIPIGIIVLVGVLGALVNPVVGIIFAVLLFLGLIVGLGYLSTRWSLYFASVLFKEDTPGISRSWRLTKGRGWKVFGLFIIFFLIISIVTFVLELVFSMLLGNSVLLSMIINAATIFTTMVTTVGYAVVYFDLRLRTDADDVKGMLEDYHTT